MEFTSEHILLQNTPFGDIQIRYYGIIIVLALLVAATIAARLARRRGLAPDHVWGALTWAIIPGIVFARLWFVLFPPISLTAGCGDPSSTLPCMDTAWFLQNFFNLENGAIAVWSGGLSIFGAVIGGMLGAWLYLGPLHNPVARVFHYLFLPVAIPISFVFWVPVAIWQRVTGKEVEPYRIPPFEKIYPDEGMPVLPWLDIAGVTLPIGQFIGRWANFVNQELYGIPTDLPWGIQIAAANRVGEYRSMVEYPIETGFHPLFLYEGLWSLGAFFVLYSLYRRRVLREGNVFLLYLIQYSVIRFLLEFLRVEVAYLPGTQINSSQVVTGIVFVVALVIFLVRQGRTAPAQQQPVENVPKRAEE